MVKVGIIGATGYAGGELVRLLLAHKGAEIVWYGSRSYIDKKYADVYKNMFQLVADSCLDDNIAELAKQADVIFTATPQGYCASVIDEALLKETRVIDLSADFRIKDIAAYESWYGLKHQAPEFVEEAVYGLCELNREAVKRARLVANPGCYPTCSFLSIYPALKEGLIDPKSLIIDAKSGTSGAGRGAKVDTLYCEVNENIKAYGVSSHRHTPEIEEQLSRVCGMTVMVNFTPHLVPMNRGILITAYGNLKDEVAEADVRRVYENYYKEEQFVRFLPSGSCPETKWTKGSNYVDVGIKVDQRTRRLIMMGAMDNLVKGAAGQAVQNMNLMFSFAEGEGLLQAPFFP